MRTNRLLQQVGLALIALTAALAFASFLPGTRLAGAQFASPTPTSGVIQLPTATLTPIGGPTATPTRTPTITPVLAQALGTPTNLRAGPGLDFEIVGVLSEGDTVPVVGRSVTFPWLVVSWAEGPDGQAWVFEQLVQVIGDITTVPIIEPPALPTIEPTQFALQQTATVVLQTPGAAETATAQAFLLPTGVYTVTPGMPSFIPGSLPTFTPPPPLEQAEELPPPPGALPGRGPAPAIFIIGLGLLGALTLAIGLLRRL